MDELKSVATVIGITVVLVVASPHAAAQAYKWTDAQGKVHFSDTPPPDGKADKITIKPQTAENPQAAAKSRDWRAQVEASNMRQRQEQLKQDAAERQGKVDAANCSNARRDLDVMTRERPVYRIGKDGQKEYLDDKDRPAALQRAQDRVAAACR